MVQTMSNDIATVHQAMVTRSNDAKGHGHIVPRLNRQQKTGDVMDILHNPDLENY